MKLLFAALALFSLSFNPALADIEAGFAAAQAGDFETAFKEYKAEADAGNGEAQYLLSNMYIEGIGIESSQEEGLKWLKASAENNFAEAQFALSLLYLNGSYVIPNEEEAFKWALKAAEADNLMAKFTLATFYLQGTGTAVNAPLGVEWHKKAAVLGLAESQFILSALYENGIGVEKDMDQSLAWIKQAAINNNAEAAQKLNSLGISINLDPEIESNRIVERAEIALYKEDFQAAYSEYLQAANMENPLAQYQIGYFHLMGMSVAINFTEAHKWFLMAAKNGDALAQFNIGMMHVRGDGLERDIVKAATWFLITRATNPDVEGDVLQGLITGMTEEQKTEAEQAAKEWFKQNAAKDLSES